MLSLPNQGSYDQHNCKHEVLCSVFRFIHVIFSGAFTVFLLFTGTVSTQEADESDSLVASAVSSWHCSSLLLMFAVAVESDWTYELHNQQTEVASQMVDVKFYFTIWLVAILITDTIITWLLYTDDDYFRTTIAFFVFQLCQYFSNSANC